MSNSFSEGFKHTVDALSVATTVGAITKMLPEVSALFTIIWMLIRIWESETVKKLTGRIK